MAPAPESSARIYVRVSSADIALFRFLLEAHDNLGVFTVVNKFEGVLMVRFSPQQRREVEGFLRQAGTEMAIEVLPGP